MLWSRPLTSILPDLCHQDMSFEKWQVKYLLRSKRLHDRSPALCRQGRAGHWESALGARIASPWPLLLLSAVITPWTSPCVCL